MILNHRTTGGQSCPKTLFEKRNCLLAVASNADKGFPKDFSRFIRF